MTKSDYLSRVSYVQSRTAEIFGEDTEHVTPYDEDAGLVLVSLSALEELFALEELLEDCYQREAE